ncbi:MAG: magnesium transporter [Pseudomonadota bacterium]
MSQAPSEDPQTLTPADDTRDTPELPVRDIRTFIETENRDQLLALVEPLHEADVADIIEQLSPPERSQFVTLLADEFTPEVLSELRYSVRSDLLDAIPNAQIAEALEQLETDDSVDILQDLNESDQREVLDAFDNSAERRAIEEALTYPEDSAGRLMQRQHIAVPEYWSIGRTIDYLRDNQALTSEFWEIFVVDPRYRPVGTLALSHILRSARDVSVSDIMLTEQTFIPVDMDQEEVAYRFQQYHLISAAVTDPRGRLVGMITVDDVVGVINEEAEEDILALAGVSESDVNTSIVQTTKTRFIWLFVNLITAVLASLVIALFEDEIGQLVALAVLMPIVASMGGNAGTQTLTVTVRSLATRDLSGANLWRVLNREVVVSFINGVLLAIILGVVSSLWFENLELGAVIAFSMIINLVAAGLAGMLVPVVLDRLKIDPAVASSVFVTTVTDIVGFFVFLGLAAYILL